MRQPDAAMIEPPILLGMCKKLWGTEASLTAILQMVEPLVARAKTNEPGVVADSGSDGFDHRAD